jgi:signal transduction histidine kinase
VRKERYRLPPGADRVAWRDGGEAAVPRAKGTPRAASTDQGLLHDARNLLGAIGLYSDLLALPGVLKPQHLHYAAELRLLGARSTALMEQLMRGRVDGPAGPVADLDEEAVAGGAIVGRPAAVSLRVVLERCAGLLTRVAGGHLSDPERLEHRGHRVEVSYGPASSLPVRVEEEAVERILVNLVRNAAAALDAAPHRANATIRVGLGWLTELAGESRPWPFRSLRLTVEDDGCGMTGEQVERLLRPGRTAGRDGRGIGFQVVRELVAGSGGRLEVVSERGRGTRVQIAWPVAAPAGEMDDLPDERLGEDSMALGPRNGRRTAAAGDAVADGGWAQ